MADSNERHRCGGDIITEDSLALSLSLSRSDSLPLRVEGKLEPILAGFGCKAGYNPGSAANESQRHNAFHNAFHNAQYINVFIL